MTDRTTSGPADYLAAERTFLAWIRTGLAMMGFGFVVARFGLFLQSLRIVHGAPPVYGYSFWFGTVLVMLGVVVNLVSMWDHVRLIRVLNRGGSDFKHPSSLGLSVAVVLALVGLALSIYLILSNELKEEHPMNANPATGIITQPSRHSVDETIQKVEALLQAKGAKLFALVDHSGEAESAGLTMRPTKLIIFGNPKAGTPLMLASPGAAIDLPLKILVSEDAAGQVWISYNTPAYLQARHGFPADLLPNIAVVEALAKTAAE
jgi:uncharacterized protein (DUF302 family)/uncharacterized membrane protein YidH (DUF202 family)